MKASAVRSAAAFQRDSWNRVWTFLDWNLDPFRAAAPTATK